MNKLLAVALLSTGFVALHAADKPAEKPADAPAAAKYPLTTCVVSDEELGSMGKPVEYVHKENGQPDRLVLLCCRMCVPQMKKEPAKFLAKLDAAEAAAKNAKK